jgi:hypothetical protein
MQSSVKSQLAIKLQERVSLRLKELDFAPDLPNKKRSGLFPTLYSRTRGEIVEVIHFLWRKFDLPLFVVEFAALKSDSEKSSYDADKSAIYFQCRIYSEIGCLPLHHRYHWFGVSRFQRLRGETRAIDNLINKTIARIDEVDDWFKHQKQSDCIKCGPNLT